MSVKVRVLLACSVLSLVIAAGRFTPQVPIPRDVEDFSSACSLHGPLSARRLTNFAHRACIGSESAFRDFQPCSTFEARILRGLDPVHRLKALENAPGSENPTR
jgi:hypothetical protein